MKMLRDPDLVRRHVLLAIDICRLAILLIMLVSLLTNYLVRSIKRFAELHETHSDRQWQIRF